MVQNPNWPVMEYAICLPGSPGTGAVLSQTQWLDVTSRTDGTTSVTRGKQYELDQVQPGAMTFTLRNDDGAFDPANTSSPYNGFILPYRLVRLRAMWPVSINLLLADQATARFSSIGAYTGSTLPQWIANTGAQVSTTIITGSGINQYQCAYASGAAAGQGYLIQGFSVAPGTSYAFRLTASTATATAISARVSIQWFNASGGIISTVNGGTVALTTSATTLSVIGVAPSNAAGGRVTMFNTTAPGAGVNVKTSNLQLEENTTNSTYATPGTWYGIYTGYIERWPQEWTSAGNKGLSNLACVDLFTFLANNGLEDPFRQDLINLGPNFLYPFNETSGSTQFVDATGNRPNATIVLSAASTVVPGSTITSGDNSPQGDTAALTGGFLGAPGPVLNMATYPASTTRSLNGGMITIPPNPSTGLVGVPASGPWTRLIAARATDLPPDGVGWMWEFVNGDPLLTNGGFNVLVVGGGIPTRPGWSVSFGGGGTSFSPFKSIAEMGQTTITDTDWHLYGISFGAHEWQMSDSTVVDVGATSPFNDLSGSPARGCVDGVGAQASTTGAAASQFVGDIAFYCELPFEITPTIWAQIYSSWRNGWGTTTTHSETSDQRYQRILNWIGYSDTPVLSAGLEIAYGPAIDIVGGLTPTDALTALQNVVDTELGQHFVNQTGQIVFQSRADRYNQTSQATFGENTAGGEIPYADAKTDFDPTRITNDVQVSAAYGNAAYRSTDPTSQVNYGIVSSTRTANSMDPNSLTAQSQAILYENAQPHQRLEALPIDVSPRPATWPTVLGIELGETVTVKRRPVSAPVITIAGFVEQIVWAFSGDGTATWTVQVSNNALHTFFQLDSATLGVLDTSVLGY